MARENYFDNAATTRLDDRVLEEMLPYLREDFGNAHSIHQWGKHAEAAVALARERVASLLNAEDPSQVFFTSGATEANNWFLGSTAPGLISPFEHSSVREPALRFGWGLLPNEEYELLSPASPPSALSIMAVNNEVGTIFHCQNDAILHRDLTQALGKIPVEVENLDFASMSAHKLYGPKGIGALFAKVRPPEAILVGGDQENGARAGTLAVPLIVGFGAACVIAEQEMEADSKLAFELRSIVLEELNGLSDWTVNGGANVSPFILSLSFDGLEGETLVIELDRAGFGISSGAACSSRSSEPSHVLTAVGLPKERLRGTVRISFGRWNTHVSSAHLARNLRRTAEKLRTMT